MSSSIKTVQYRGWTITAKRDGIRGQYCAWFRQRSSGWNRTIRVSGKGAMGIAIELAKSVIDKRETSLQPSQQEIQS